MFFLNLSGTDVDFLDWKLWWRTYIIKRTFLTTRHVKLVDKKEFVIAELDPKHETYVVRIGSVSFAASPSSSPLDFYPICRSQIASLIAKEAPTKILDEYVDFVDVFSPDSASKFPKHIEINNYFIELVDAHGFIRPFKSPASTPIIFDQKSDGFIQLCVKYRGLNKLMIKNQYLLPLVGELLDG